MVLLYEKININKRDKPNSSSTKFSLKCKRIKTKLITGKIILAKTKTTQNIVGLV